MKRFLLSSNTDLALLILRVTVGIIMVAGHGWGKLMGFDEKFHTFSDPFGVGHEFSYIVAVGAEFFCSILVVLGLFTRIAVIPLIITMFTAAFVVLSDSPWGKKESAVMFLIPFITLFFSGPGKYSLDHMLFSKRLK